MIHAHRLITKTGNPLTPADYVSSNEFRYLSIISGVVDWKLNWLDELGRWPLALFATKVLFTKFFASLSETLEDTPRFVKKVLKLFHNKKQFGEKTKKGKNLR